MLCTKCGVHNPEPAQFCHSCGAATATVPDVEVAFLNPCSPWKLVILCTLTFNIYLFYWSWKHWSIQKTRDPDISPAWRTIFGGIWFYALARLVKEEAESRGVRCRYSPAVLIALLWVFALIRIVPNSVWIHPLVVLPILPVQAAINRINRTAAPSSITREWFSRRESFLFAPLALCWALVLLVVLLVPPGLGGRADPEAGPPVCERPCLISFTRSGGFSPVNESLVVNDDGTLVRMPTPGRSIRGTASSEELARLRVLVGSDAFAVLETSYVNPDVLDAVFYTVKTSAGKEIVTNGGQPDVLAQVIDACETMMREVR